MSEFSVLDWLSEPKSERFRRGLGFGTFAILAFGAPLFFVVLASAAIPHCKTCGEGLGTDIVLATVLATASGVLIGVGASFARSVFERYLSSRWTVSVLLLVTVAAAYLLLQPALDWIAG